MAITAGAVSQVEGSEALQKVLQRLPAELARNALASVARAGAQELQRAAYAQLALAMRNRTPREDDVITVKRRTAREDIKSQYDVGPPRRKPQLRWLHQGTASHYISALIKFGTRRGQRNVQIRLRDNSRAILASLRRREFYGRTVQHPGTSPTYWLRTAQHLSRDAVTRAMAQALRKALPKQVKKLASRAYTRKLLGG